MILFNHEMVVLTPYNSLFRSIISLATTSTPPIYSTSPRSTSFILVEISTPRVQQGTSREVA